MGQVHVRPRDRGKGWVADRYDRRGRWTGCSIRGTKEDAQKAARMARRQMKTLLLIVAVVSVAVCGRAWAAIPVPIDAATWTMDTTIPTACVELDPDAPNYGESVPFNEDLIVMQLFGQAQNADGTWGEPELIVQITVDDPVAGAPVGFETIDYIRAHKNQDVRFMAVCLDGWRDADDNVHIFEHTDPLAGVPSMRSVEFETDTQAPGQPGQPVYRMTVTGTVTIEGEIVVE